MSSSDLKYPGIPETLTLALAEDWVRPQISEKRFQHTCGVVATAAKIATRIGCDPYLAKLSGWLHDACKQVKDKKLIQLAQEWGLPVNPLERQHGHLLHGPVAAAKASRELGLQSPLVLNAIAEHTLGAPAMSQLSQVCFLADCLEASRPDDYTGPIWQALNLDGQPDLERAILTACDLNLKLLIDSNRPIHPRTVETRNYYLNLLPHR